MTLAPYETARFYRGWRPLLSYVNARVRVLSDLSPNPPEGSVSPADLIKVRDALWRDDSLREAFMAENPAGLPPEDLALMGSWSRRIVGQYYIYRHLKKHTVVLTASGKARAYGVLGLVSPLSEVVRQQPPVLVNLVLLPFEDRITYDGLVTSSSITFGPGIRAGLDDNYRAARERGGVVTSLLPADAVGRERVVSELRAGNALVLRELRKDLAASGMSSKKLEEHAGNAEALAEAMLLGPEPRPLLDVTPEDLRASLALRGPNSRISLKRLARFLERSERVEWGTLQGITELG